MLIVLAGFVGACGAPQPEPRSYFVFMEDGLAREGVLARCNQDRQGTARDVECANARRAAAAIAVEQERARSAELARESQRKLVALRDRAASAALTQEAAAAAARAAAQSAYEAQWRDPSKPIDAVTVSQAAGTAPVFGAPLGPVLPSMSESSLFDVYADAQPPPRPSLEIAAVEPPVSAVEIARPEFELEEVAIVPRPFRVADVIAIPQ